MTPKELSNIDSTVRKMINDHLTTTGKSLSAFSKECKVHQSQLWLYLNTADRGLHTSTLKKIGQYLHKNS